MAAAAARGAGRSPISCDSPRMLPIVDLHCDTVLDLSAGADLVAGNPGGHVDFERLAAGRVALQFFACFVPTVRGPGRAFPAVTGMLDALDAACARWPERLVRVRTAAQAEALLDATAPLPPVPWRTGAIAAVENGHAIEDDLGKLEALAARGVRYMTLTHSRHLSWAASSGEAGDGPGGLTAFGREVVARMNALGMIVDVSHVHATTFRDVVRCCRGPFIASHSCAAALCPTGRNLDDEQLRALAAAGGVCGVNFYPGFLDPRYFRKHGASVGALFETLEALERTTEDPAELQAAYHANAARTRAAQGPPDADVDTVCDHIEHVMEIAGPDHVAFGSDFDGIPDVPRGVENASAYPALCARLRERGHSDDVLERLAFRNVLRVLREADRS